MKRLYRPLLVLTLVFAVLLSGCKKKEKLEEVIVPIPTPKPVEQVSENEKEIIMKEFTNVLKEDEPSKLIAFMNENIGKLTELEGDLMIDGLENQLIDHMETFRDNILEKDKDGELMKIWGENLGFPEENIGQIKSDELKLEVKKTYEHMYKLVNLEGDYYPIIDYGKFKNYNEFITEEWKDYIAIKAMDSDRLPLVDGALTISFDELSDRILLTENYLNKYVDGQRQEEMLALYENKLAAYLKGVPNTAIANRDTNKIYEDVLVSYEKTSNVENYITSFMVYKYLEIIKDNDNIIDKYVLGEADKILEEALDILREFK